MSKETGILDSLRLVVLAGDGIGPEIMTATMLTLGALQRVTGIRLEFQERIIGFDSLKACGTTLTEDVIEACKAADGVILGPVQHNDYPPVIEGGLNPSGVLRKRLDLFANVRPAKSITGFAPPCGKPIDLVVMRENTEGFYADRSMFLGNGEFMPTPDVALSIRKITRVNSLRIAEEAFKLASRRRKKVTAVHKANVLRVSDGLFLECVRSVAVKYSHVEYDEKIVDAMAALLIRDPGAFDVVLATNMFGDILSDEATEISGSIGLAASINVGYDHGVAQAQHGSAPDLAGRDCANPASLIGSVAMLLAWIAERRKSEVLMHASVILEGALGRAIEDPNSRTQDLGGRLGTRAFSERVAAIVDDGYLGSNG
jgi:3-isopropylmalate dehydrogenase